MWYNEPLTAGKSKADNRRKPRLRGFSLFGFSRMEDNSDGRSTTEDEATIHRELASEPSLAQAELREAP